MNKIGILTFHYSNNYGGVLQCYALYETLKNKGYDVEVIDYVPKSYNTGKLMSFILENKNNIQDIGQIIKKLNIKLKYSKKISMKFDEFRKRNMKFSKKVNENTITTILNDYDTIIVGSDQIWNPGQRSRCEYFLNFDENFKGNKVSYAADSTTSEIDIKDNEFLKKSINDFKYISVRNTHSYEFVKKLTDKDATIVGDPTLLYDFNKELLKRESKDKYILVYILGDEIEGSHKEALNKIKQKYGDLPVYAVVIPTVKFDIFKDANKIFYDIGPEEWLTLIKNASFVYTDSFHGVLFSIKFNVPFLAYYKEALRATRFIDLGERYNIKDYIVNSVEEIENKASIDGSIDFIDIKNRINKSVQQSIGFLNKALKN